MQIIKFSLLPELMLVKLYLLDHFNSLKEITSTPYTCMLEKAPMAWAMAKAKDLAALLKSLSESLQLLCPQLDTID